MKEFDPVEIDGKLKPAIAILNFDNKRMPFIDKDKANECFEYCNRY